MANIKINSKILKNVPTYNNVLQQSTYFSLNSISDWLCLCSFTTAVGGGGDDDGGGGGGDGECECVDVDDCVDGFWCGVLGENFEDSFVPELLLDRLFTIFLLINL